MTPRPQRCQRLRGNQLSEYEEFLRINMRLAPITVETSVQIAKRFLKSTNNIVSYETIKNYLATYLDKAPKTYNSQITDLRRFIRDFLGCEDLIKSFKMAPVDEAQRPTEIPTRKQMRKGFEVQRDSLECAVYLFTATTGLRRCEILGLVRDNINTGLRSVIPNHYTRKKRSGVTFYNSETEMWLSKYWQSRTDSNPKVFVISERKWRQMWHTASKATGIKITPQVLRKWFATEMGERLIPDRFIDIFQGRAPRSVLAKHYTGKGVLRLKRIYDKAQLKVLG